MLLLLFLAINIFKGKCLHFNMEYSNIPTIRYLDSNYIPISGVFDYIG